MSVLSEIVFHTSRIAFAELPSGDIVKVINDSREHSVWLKDDYAIEQDIFVTLVRGYIKGNNILFYKGLNFSNINDDTRLLSIADRIGVLAEGKNVYDGVIVGSIGEEWEPKNLIRKSFSIDYKV